MRLRMSDEDVGAFCGAPLRVPGPGIKPARPASTPRASSRCMPWDTSVPSARRPRSHRSRRLLGDRAHRQARGRERLRDTTPWPQRLSQILVNALGRSVKFQGALQPELLASPPVPGDDLMLALDLRAQQAAETALGDRRGAVVAIDPANGDVLALASRPGFDPSLFVGGMTRTEYGRSPITRTSRCSIARCAALTLPARPSSR